MKITIIEYRPKTLMITEYLHTLFRFPVHFTIMKNSTVKPIVEKEAKQIKNKSKQKSINFCYDTVIVENIFPSTLIQRNVKI